MLVTLTSQEELTHIKISIQLSEESKVKKIETNEVINKDGKNYLKQRMNEGEN